MKTLNRVELLGYVGNPEVIIMKNGVELLKCSLATHESFKTKIGNWETETTWHRIEFWNNKPKEVSCNIKKGDRLKVDGKMIINQYTDKEGVKRSALMIRANHLDVVANDFVCEQALEIIPQEKIF